MHIFWVKTVKIFSASGTPPPNSRLPLATGRSALRSSRCNSHLPLRLYRIRL